MGAYDSISMPAYLYDPEQRDKHYGTNVAQYLCDLHDNKAVFDFCGGMNFQFQLSDMLRQHLARVAKDDNRKQPLIFDRRKDRLAKIPNYTRSAKADNVTVFHGREVRKVPTANGGMGLVLLLSLANTADPQGWTNAEEHDYNGWAHDSKRPWRDGWALECDGFKGFDTQFGEDAFALHHRFYFHFDHKNQMWLSAEDGCEGEPIKWG